MASATEVGAPAVVAAAGGDGAMERKSTPEDAAISFADRMNVARSGVAGMAALSARRSASICGRLRSSSRRHARVCSSSWPRATAASASARAVEVALRFGDRIANHHRRTTARVPPTIASSVRRFTVDPRSARRGPRPPPR